MRKVWKAARRALACLGDIMGAVMTTIILTLVFFLLITPVGFIRKLFGKDPLLLKGSRASSYFSAAPKHYTKEDLEKEY